MNKIYYTKEQDEFIKKNLLEKKSIIWISKELGYSREAISNRAKILMGPDFDMRRKSYIILDYFSEINTPEKAYWLGFLAADGYICKDSLSIQLQKRDKTHLQKFSNAIQGNLTIQEINGTNNFGKDYSHYRVAIKSKQLVEDLAKHGVYQNKSLTLSKPDLDENFLPYWIIGYMDGDGCITKNKKKMRIIFTGTLNVLEFIKEYLHSNNKIRLEHRCQNTYNLQLENDLSLAFLTKYDYIHLPYVLDRKKDFVSLYSSLIQ